MKAFIASLLFFAFIASAFATLPRVHAWEKANAYPYGKMCDVFRNCRAR